MNNLYQYFILILQAAPDVSQTPFGLGGIGGLGGLSGLGMGSANFMEMQQRMQREVIICFLSRLIVFIKIYFLVAMVI